MKRGPVTGPLFLKEVVKYGNYRIFKIQRTAAGY